MSDREKLIEAMARAIWEREGFIDGDFDGDGDPFRRLTWDELVEAEGEYNPTVTLAREQAGSALAALEASGVRLVPVVASNAMIHALDKGLHDKWPNAHAMATEAHRLMLAASPYANQEPGQ